MRAPLSRLTILITAGALAGCNAAADEMPQAAHGNEPPPCQPLETRDPNGRDQRPAFPGQTRACGVESNVAFEVEVIATGLEHPWSVEPLPDGDLLVTERPGRMRIVGRTGTVGAPLAGLPPVGAGGQGGLLDVALSPDFANDRTVFWSYTEPRQGGNGTSVARGVLSADRRSLEQVRVIYRSVPTYANRMHFGSRVVPGPDGNLYITMGERSDASMRHHAQELDNHLGKVVRITPDGAAPADNPFVGRPGALPEIWDLGHRNVQAAAFDERGRLWTVEHGPRGGDELNLIEPGNNYGWPRQSYGIEYSGAAIAGASTQAPGTVQPVYYWDPVIAPSGAQWYSGSAFPEWRGDLFIGGMGAERLVRLELTNDRVTGEEHLLADRGQRIRDVRQGPDGALYVVTDEDDGELWRIAPR
jgi:glucose/arabinose dehydrogenase